MAENTSVRALVEAFSADLEELIREEIRRGFEAALGTTSPPVRRGPGRPPKAALPASTPATPVSPKFARPGRKKGEKRTPAQLAALKDALLAQIKKSVGKRIEEIGAEMKIPTKDLSRPVRQLIEAKKVKTTGEKRATRYFPA